MSNEGNTIIKTNIEFIQGKAGANIPLQLEVVDAVKWKGQITPKGTLGATKEIGNTNKNEIDVLARPDSQIDGMSRTLAHEVGHAIGLAHPDHADARETPSGGECFTCPVSPVDKVESPNNLMRQTKRVGDIKNDVVLEPKQTQEVAKVIKKNGGNIDTSDVKKRSAGIQTVEESRKKKISEAKEKFNE